MADLPVVGDGEGEVEQRRLMPTRAQWEAASARQALYASVRKSFAELGYQEVETPALVPAPGMEPHIRPFETPFVPETNRLSPRTLYLHTSPEYAMKRLLADGCGPIFQLGKVFRNGEISQAHNPEFTLLEFYRPGGDYLAIMADLERVLCDADRALGARGVFAAPFEQLTVAEAMLRFAGVDLGKAGDGPALAEAAERAGARIGAAGTFEDVFFHLFLQKIEPQLGIGRPCFLTEYPASMASLARLKIGDPSVAERFELYVDALELANGFSELTDAVEQRRRLEEERAARTAQGKPAYPIDERFLDAVGRMPPSGGVAVGLDRILMLLLGARTIDEVLLFPASEY